MLLKVLPLGFAVLGAAVFSLWRWSGTNPALAERIPGLDRPAGTNATGGFSTKWEGRLLKASAAAPTGFNGTWPCFRGANLDSISTETVPLARTWPAGGPPRLWQIDVDEGYAAPAVWKGRVYLIDYDPTNRVDALRCLSLADGQELWRYTYPVKIKRYHGRTRTVPAVTEQHVVSFGPKCDVICCYALTGELRWRMNLVQEFNSTVPEWYAGQCPIIDRGRVILAPGADALLIAVDLATGQVVWKSPNPRQALMTHGSITPVEFQGRRLFVYGAHNGVVGVAADDGRILWDFPDWKITMANVPAPVPVGDGRIFLSGGYGAGSMMIQLKEEAGKLTVQPLFRLKPNVFGSTQQTPILYQNHLFGVRQDADQQLACLGLDGKVVWSSGSANKFGKGGPYLIAQGLIYVLDDEGKLTLAEATATGFKKLAEAQVLHGHESWGPMALADGRLLVRDLTKLACLDVSAK
ncbi:MAG: PQQ-binding-like beta-propeller repeat protein [Verrucomicrobia bacterium]|nr:PQQ-binding-like beta-propeller repeat protein [Verrucomicrobiota bacterium]